MIILPIFVLVDLLNGESLNSYLDSSNRILSNGTHIASYWLICCFLAFGFLKRVSWTRYVIIFIYVLASLYWLIFNPISGELVSGIVGISLSYWYFFKKANVVEYFRNNYNQALNEDASDNSNF